MERLPLTLFLGVAGQPAWSPQVTCSRCLRSGTPAPGEAEAVRAGFQGDHDVPGYNPETGSC